MSKRKKQRRGLFIVIDGLGGSGKTTVAQLLRIRFPRGTVFTREPGGTSTVEVIRAILKRGSRRSDPLLDFLLFWAVRVEHIRERILPALKRGTSVITDRFDSSTFAIQVCAEKKPAGMSVSLLEKLFWSVRAIVLKECEPDFYFILDVPPQVGEARRKRRVRGEDRFDERDRAFQRKVRAGYQAFARRIGKRAQVIDASQDMHAIVDEIVALVELRKR